MQLTTSQLLLLLSLLNTSAALPLDGLTTTTILEIKTKGLRPRQTIASPSSFPAINNQVLPANPKSPRRTRTTSTARPTSSPSQPTATPTTPAPPSSPPPTTPPPSTPTGNPGLSNGVTFWKLKTTFNSLASFSQAIARANWSWGSLNVQTIDYVPSKRYSATGLTLGKSTSGIGLSGGLSGGGGTGEPRANNGSVLVVRFPIGSVNPSNLPVGGTGFYGLPLDLSRANNVSLGYSVFFPVDFDFVKGGKLPGLYGGTRGCSGGNPAVDCWSTRLMWRSDGKGELYLYAPRDKQTTATCTLPPVSYCNSKTGMSIGRGSWSFRRGEWTDGRQDIWMNTPGKPDGGFNIWINGKLALSSESVFYRNLPNIKVGLPGTIPTPRVELIDYDSLPANITIPNGGFARSPAIFIPSPSPPSSSSAIVPESTPTITLVSKLALSDQVLAEKLEKEKNKGMRIKRQDFSTTSSEGSRNATASPLEEEVFDPSAFAEEQKIRTSSYLPIGFIGIMFNTFFGGSDSSWASPRTQYCYFNQVSLRITG